MKILLLTLSALFFYGYFFLVAFKFGAQKSISMSVYCWSKKMRFIFILAIAGFTLPIIIASQDQTLMPVAAWLVMGAGAACNILKEKTTKFIHMAAVLSGVALAAYSLVAEYHMVFMAAWTAIAAIIVAISSKKHRVWWVEFTAFTGMLTSLFTHYVS